MKQIQISNLIIISEGIFIKELFYRWEYQTYKFKLVLFSQLLRIIFRLYVSISLCLRIIKSYKILCDYSIYMLIFIIIYFISIFKNENSVVKIKSYAGAVESTTKKRKYSDSEAENSVEKKIKYSEESKRSSESEESEESEGSGDSEKSEKSEGSEESEGSEKSDSASDSGSGSYSESDSDSSSDSGSDSGSFSGSESDPGTGSPAPSLVSNISSPPWVEELVDWVEPASTFNDIRTWEHLIGIM